MSDFSTIYIDCNKAGSNDKDNLDNSQYTTDLKNSITLPTGSKISIQSSFINQQGITGSSIEIEEDIVEEFCYLIYKTDTVDIIPNVATSPTDPVYFNVNFTKGSLATDTREHLLDQTAGTIPNATGVSQILEINASGATEQPLILLKAVVGGGTTVADVDVRTNTITIKKGTYGITELSNLITDQINGRVDSNYNEINPTQQRIVDGNYSKQNISAGTLHSIEIPQTTYAGNLPNPKNSAHGETYIFTDAHTAEHLRTTRIALNNGTGLLYSDAGGNGIGDTTGMSQLLQHSGNNPDYDPLRNQFYVGTNNMSVDYNSNSSAFEISGLHMPFTCPSHDIHFNSQALEGKDVVFFRRANKAVEAAVTTNGASPMTTTAKNLLLSSFSNPVSRLGGIIVHNWALRVARKYGTKKGILDNPIVYNNYKFKEFFNEENDARDAWKKTLWSRLGFTYDQLNSDDNFENIRYYNSSNTQRLPGSTTNTYVDNSILQSISTQVNNSHYDDSDAKTPLGPGIGDKVISGTLRTYTTADANSAGDVADLNNVGLYTNTIYSQAVMIPVEAAGRPITARNLPTLSKVGYYLITSDILDGYNDIVKNGDPIALLGVVAKSSLSNQDFIYSSQDITNTITNEKIISKVKIRFLNPDLTSPSLESNSSVILRIDVPQVETQGQLMIQAEEEKEEKK